MRRSKVVEGIRVALGGWQLQHHDGTITSYREAFDAMLAKKAKNSEVIHAAHLALNHHFGQLGDSLPLDQRIHACVEAIESIAQRQQQLPYRTTQKLQDWMEE